MVYLWILPIGIEQFVAENDHLDLTVCDGQCHEMAAGWPMRTSDITNNSPNEAQNR
jgi:hypothetical protein